MLGVADIRVWKGTSFKRYVEVAQSNCDWGDFSVELIVDVDSAWKSGFPVQTQVRPIEAWIGRQVMYGNQTGGRANTEPQQWAYSI